MRLRAVPPTVALLLGVLVTLGCVADASLATTPVVPPTQARPNVASTPNLTPQLPPKPVAPAAGTYFVQVIGVDALGGNITLTAICLGADRKVMRELPANDKAPRVIPLLSTSEITVFLSPPNNPAAGRMSTVDLLQLADIVRANAAAKYFLVVEPQGVKSLEQDSGVRPSPQQDDPCPHL
jgi:hypothetical protein